LIRQTSLRGLAGTAFAAILLASLALLLVRVWFGPLPGLISLRTTLNVEAAAILALGGWLLTRNRETVTVPAPSPAYRPAPLAIAVCVATALAFSPSIPAPFLFDDYRHLMFAVNESWRALFNRVVLHHPTGGDLFFRPLGDFVFLWLYQWAHFDFRWWHAAGVALHVANTALVFLLAKRICGGWLGATVAALFFGWHAAHVEAVSWSSALYDLLATFFVLLALLEVMARGGKRWRYFAITALGVPACVSKESAFCLPLLAALLVVFHPPAARRPAWRKTLCLLLACAMVFAFRFWNLRGLGGYLATSGGALGSNFRLLSVVQALGLRLWALLFVPVNWSVPPGLALKIAFTALVVAVLAFAKHARLAPQRAALIALFTLCAALPALSLLLIGFDLAGARVLYLPSVGFALLWAEIAESVPSRREAALFCTLLLAFQFTALQHNQALWVPVAQTARQACTTAGAVLRQDAAATLFAWNLPRTENGVYFLRNAFPFCVAINAGVKDERIEVGDALPPVIRPHEYVVVWDEALRRLVIRNP
jgi:hypothetical protein